MEKFQSRNFNILLYPDDITHADVLSKIQQKFDCAYITHTKDLETDGFTLKKAHIHVVIKIGNSARWSSAVCKELGLATNYCQECRSLKKSLEYLIHYNNPDKYQYSLNDVNGSLKTKLIQFINDEGLDENDKVKELYNFIFEFNGYLKLSDFSAFAVNSGYWDIFRRSAVIFIKLIEEHNNSL